MLTIVVPKTSLWNERNETFIDTKETVLVMEHSLVSISKWESIWKKPFISKSTRTYDETISYAKCMTITQNIPDDVYYALSVDNINDINNYIADPMTATWFSASTNEHSRRSSEQITSELIYYWMIALNIPFECQKWHLNRLLTLIRVCDIKNTPPKKRSKNELLNRNAEINKARREMYSKKT